MRALRALIAAATPVLAVSAMTAAVAPASQAHPIAAGSVATTVRNLPGTSCSAFPADNYWHADVSGLPPTWLATGELDLFRDEDVEYASRLFAGGVRTELHVYPGAVHGFDLFAPDAAVSRRYRRDRDEALDRFVGIAPNAG